LLGIILFILTTAKAIAAIVLGENAAWSVKKKKSRRGFVFWNWKFQFEIWTRTSYR
jgi:hypothetical protein